MLWQKLENTMNTRGTSDTSGAYSHSWNITSNTPSAGKSDVLVSASAAGSLVNRLQHTGGSPRSSSKTIVGSSKSYQDDLVVPGDNQTTDA